MIMEKKKKKVQVFSLLSLATVLLCVFMEIVEAQSKPFFINCGSNSSVNAGGRTWVGDSSPGTNLTLSSVSTAGETPAPIAGETALGSLYRTARLFAEPLNYTFRGLSNGQHALRLHFCPFPFADRDVNESSFGVAANGLRLVSELSVPGEISHRNSFLQSSGGNSSSVSLVKEYILAVSSGNLVLEFSPQTASFGFVSAIELVPIANGLFPDSAGRVGGSAVSLNLADRGIEIMYRLNVGGPEIGPGEDGELWRRWEVDSSYMITANAGSEVRNSSGIAYASANDTSAAPLEVYESARSMSNNQVLEKRFNMSWKFEVHRDFEYLVRLHFCELQFGKAKERTFRIYINNRTAADGFDVFSRAGGKNRAYHHDFVDSVSSRFDTLWIQLGPDTTAGAAVTDAFLNGLEIFKLSRNGNLAYVELYEAAESSSGKSKSLVLWVGIGAGAALVAVLACVSAFAVCFCRGRRSSRSKPSDAKNNASVWRPLFLHGSINASTGNATKGSVTQNLYGSVASTRVGRRFTLAEIRAATKNFDEKLVIGVGGFGKVYKGETEDGTLAAIKRANPQSEQGLSEFETEIEMLSKLRHRHLVCMIGFCEEQREMILVYEYMANGTLRSHLFGSDLPPLTWKQRLEACIGAARGLHYLHTGAERGIIHRDVKTTNILLDENFVAKMADFGLSKDGPALDHTHVSTAVKGSFGYLDPEYYRRQQLTEKSDVYSFGVVLFEVVCSRAVINPTLPKDQINLAEWAMKWQRQRSLETIADPRLKGGYSPDSLKKFGEIAEKCLADEGKNRPTMGEVLWHLEYVLQLHEAWVRSNATADNSVASTAALGGLAEERQEGQSLEAETSSKGMSKSTQGVEIS